MNAGRCPIAPTDPDRPDGREHAAWCAHLDDCPACAEAWDAADPSRMFRVLRDEPVPRAILDAVSEGVADAIEAERFSDRRRRTRAWMATAAAVVLGAALGWTAFRTPEAGASRPAAIAAADDTGAAGGHADVRLMSSTEGVQIVDLTIGESQVVMIFDERMKL